MWRVALILALLAITIAASDRKGVNIDDLKARAEKAKGGEQAKLYAELAQALVGQADQQFNEGDAARAQTTVQEVVQYATRAHDGAIASRDQRKQVEILLRDTQRHLEGVKRTLAQVDRPPVDEAEKRLENLRQDLLDAMFAPGKKEGP